MEIEEFDTSNPVVAGMPETIFDDVVSAYVDEHTPPCGAVGGAPTHLLDAADLVRYGIAWMEREYGGGRSDRG